MSSQISSSAQSARENARTGDGRFGEQEHDRADDVSLSVQEAAVLTHRGETREPHAPSDVDYQRLPEGMTVRAGTSRTAGRIEVTGRRDGRVDVTCTRDDFERGRTVFNDGWAPYAGFGDATPEELNEAFDETGVQGMHASGSDKPGCVQIAWSGTARADSESIDETVYTSPLADIRGEMTSSGPELEEAFDLARRNHATRTR